MGKEGALVGRREDGGEASDGREEGPLILPLRGLELDGGDDGEREVGPVARKIAYYQTNQKKFQIRKYERCQIRKY